jgi:hypothetical protein
MAKYHRPDSSSRRWRIASLILFTSFFPLCYPCLTFILETTLCHPYYTFILLYCARSFYYFCEFYWALSCFYSSFLARKSASCLRPRVTLSLLSFHSFCWIVGLLRFFIWVGFGLFPLPHESVLWSHLLRSHWIHFQLTDYR